MVRGWGMAAKVRVFMLGFVAVMLSVMQACALFSPAMYVIMGKGGSKGSEATRVWEETPTPSKIACLQQAIWVWGLTIAMFTMLIFDTGSDRALCIGMAIIMLWWQLVWYLGCFGHADVDGNSTVTQSALLSAEAPFEFPLFLVFGFLSVVDWGKEERERACACVRSCVRACPGVCVKGLLTAECLRA